MSKKHFWELSPHTGRKPYYENTTEGAEQFNKDCFEYFKVTSERTDWDHQEWVGKDGEEVSRRQPVPFTLGGLCIFLGMIPDTFRDYRKKRPLFSPICTHVENIIRTQKFEGATSKHFDRLIIAKDLGLDKNENPGASIKIELAKGLEVKDKDK